MFNFSQIKKHSAKIIIGAIVLLGALSYANALPGEMLYDDTIGIRDNAYIKDWQYWPKFFSEPLTAGAGISGNYWRPTLLIIYSLGWHAWGSWVVGYHAINIIIHILNAILIFYLLRKLFSREIPAAIAAIIFTIHPVQTESVTYISGLGDPLSLLLSLIGATFFLRWRSKIALAGHNWLNYAVMIVVFLLALMTKERSVIFPGIILLIDLFIWKISEYPQTNFWSFAKKSFWRVLPLAVIAAGFLLMRGTILNFQNTFNLYNTSTYYTEHISARILTFLHVVPTYFSILLRPLDLHMNHSSEIAIITTARDSGVLLGAAILLILINLAAYTWKKNPAYSFGILWCFLMMFPISGIIVPVAGILYEHYLYAPIIGLAYICGLAICDLYQKYNNRLMGIVLSLSGAVIILILISLTIGQNLIWRDGITFYNHTLRYAPKDFSIINNLGLAYAEAGDLKRAEETFLSALSLNMYLPMAHYNLGDIYYRTGRTNQAISEYSLAMRLSPQSFFPYRALRQLYLDNKQPQEAAAIDRAWQYNRRQH